jgi:hypothetical protein
VAFQLTVDAAIGARRKPALRHGTPGTHSSLVHDAGLCTRPAGGSETWIVKNVLNRDWFALAETDRQGHSGSVPRQHLIGGYADAISERQPPMYFRLGGGTIKGVSKPGEIVWSRFYVEGGKLHADIGRGKQSGCHKRRRSAGGG